MASLYQWVQLLPLFLCFFCYHRVSVLKPYVFDTINPLKRVSFLSSDAVYGHAPGSPRKDIAVLDSVPRQDNAGQTNPDGGPCPGYYHAGDFPDVDT